MVFITIAKLEVNLILWTVNFKKWRQPMNKPLKIIKNSRLQMRSIKLKLSSKILEIDINYLIN